jgi:tetratricopeptide (TPR) repeat protein
VKVRAGAVLAILLAAATARADKQTDANNLFAKGQAKYLAGEYRDAIKFFDDAYQLVRDPVYLFNVAQSYRKLFDCIPASEYFTRFLNESTDINQKQRALVQKWVIELAPCVSERTAAAAQKPRAEELTAPPPPPPKRPVDPGRPYRIGGIAAAGVGAVGLVVGAIFSKRGANLESKLADCNLECDWTDEREATDRAGQRANLIAAISWIAGGGVLATGATLYILGHSKRKRFERLHVSAPTTGGIAVVGRFRF